MSVQKVASMHFVDLGLLAVAISWGASYSMMQLIVEDGIPIPVFLMLRFASAIPFLMLFFNLKKHRVSLAELGVGIFFGGLLYVILFLETLGVSHTTPSNAGFLIAMSVILVPFIDRLVSRERQGYKIYFAALFSVIGCFMVVMKDGLAPRVNSGDLIILAAATIRALQIVSFTRMTVDRNYSIVWITLVQMLTVTALACVSVLIRNAKELFLIFEISTQSWAMILFLGFFATFFAFYFQLFAANKVKPARIALILSLEPVFAMIMAYFIVGDRLMWIQIIGGIIIVMATLLGRNATD